MRHEDWFSLVSELTGNRGAILIHPVYVELTGSITKAIVLQQILFWTGLIPPDEWWYKTYEQWREETTLTHHKVSASAKYFKQEGFLETDVRRANGSPTVHYRLSTSAFRKWIDRKLENGFAGNRKMDLPEISQSLQSITEKTTEITTESSAARSQGTPTATPTPTPTKTVAPLPISTPRARETHARVSRACEAAQNPISDDVEVVSETSPALGWRWYLDRWAELAPSAKVLVPESYAGERAFITDRLAGIWEHICRRVEEHFQSEEDPSHWLSLDWILQEKNGVPNWRGFLARKPKKARKAKSGAEVLFAKKAVTTTK